MSSEMTLSRPYAKALFDLAKDLDQVDKWSERLKFLSNCQSNEDFASILADSRITREQKAEILVDVYPGVEKDQYCINFIKLLAENDRLNLFDAIFISYLELKLEFENTVEAKVITAVDVDKTYLNKVKASLEKRLGKSVSISQLKDETILGGAIIRAGDLVIDGSIKGKLEGLANTLIH